MAAKTFRRDKLLKLARAGKLVSVSSYSFDDMYGESRGSDTKPVHVMEDGRDFKEGFYNIRQSEFESRTGRAWIDESGVITLYVHSNSDVSFRIVE